MTKIAPYAFQQFFDNNSDPLALGKIYTYEAGTTTNKATYTDSSGLSANTNPIILDANGRANIWLGDGSYKFVLKTSADVLVATVDDLTGAVESLFGANAFTITTNTLINAAYQNDVLVCTSAVTLSLFPAATAGVGYYFSVLNLSGGTVTIDPDSAETINNASTFSVPNGTSFMVYSDGVEWYTLFGSSLTLASTNSWTGVNTFTNDIIMSGGMIRAAKGADIASATALPLLTTGNFFNVTGTTTITSINTTGTVGSRITLQFDGALTLTHHATDLILPSGANITTAAGDTADFIEYAAGDWVCVGYNRANGRAVKEKDINIFSVRDEKAAGTDAGTFTSGAWRTRTLNNELENTISGASLSANQITLPAGTYRVTASAPAFQVINHQARLYNITDGATVLSGTPEVTWSSNSTTSRSEIVGTFTIAGSKVFELQHRCSTTSAIAGLGQAANFGEAEIYSYVIIQQV